MQVLSHETTFSIPSLVGNQWRKTSYDAVKIPRLVRGLFQEMINSSINLKLFSLGKESNWLPYDIWPLVFHHCAFDLIRVSKGFRLLLMPYVQCLAYRHYMGQPIVWKSHELEEIEGEVRLPEHYDGSPVHILGPNDCFVKLPPQTNQTTSPGGDTETYVCLLWLF